MRRHAFGVRAILPVEAGAEVVLVEGNGHACGHLQFPGGKNEYGEPLLDTVTREIAEETGLRISALQIREHPLVIEQLPGVPAGNPRHRLWLVFCCHPISMAQYEFECLRRGGELPTRLVSPERILSPAEPIDDVTRLAARRLWGPEAGGPEAVARDRARHEKLAELHRRVRAQTVTFLEAALLAEAAEAAEQTDAPAPVRARERPPRGRTGAPRIYRAAGALQPDRSPSHCSG